VLERLRQYQYYDTPDGDGKGTVATVKRRIDERGSLFEIDSAVEEDRGNSWAAEQRGLIDLEEEAAFRTLA